MDLSFLKMKLSIRESSFADLSSLLETFYDRISIFVNVKKNGEACSVPGVSFGYTKGLKSYFNKIKNKVAAKFEHKNNNWKEDNVGPPLPKLLSRHNKHCLLRHRLKFPLP
jgi:hypothetical protein